MPASRHAPSAEPLLVAIRQVPPPVSADSLFCSVSSLVALPVPVNQVRRVRRVRLDSRALCVRRGGSAGPLPAVVAGEVGVWRPVTVRR